MTMGERIRELRKKAKWNQTELGEKIGMGYGGVYALEKDKSEASRDVIIKLSQVFGVSTDYLLTGKEGANDISEEEREILSVIRDDKAMRSAMMEIARVKKKVISFTRSYAAANQNVVMGV